MVDIYELWRSEFIKINIFHELDKSTFGIDWTEYDRFKQIDEIDFFFTNQYRFHKSS